MVNEKQDSMDTKEYNILLKFKNQLVINCKVNFSIKFSAAVRKVILHVVTKYNQCELMKILNDSKIKTDTFYNFKKLDLKVNWQYI